MAEDPQTLFAELDDFIQAESHEEALEVCERILALAADDGDAFHCKLISLIELGRYAEAVQAVEAHGELAAGREFEHAYCLYQLNREPEALALLDQAGLDVARNAQLAAQIRFRLGEYARAAELFQVAEGEEGGSAESSVNTLAALVSAGQTDAALAYAEQAGSSDDGAQFELLYNLACAHIEKGELGRAQLLLQRALETCRESLTAEEYSEEEIEVELGVLTAQLAFVHQLQGDGGKAMKTYTALFNFKTELDPVVAAVAGNNIVALRGGKSGQLFDSWKKCRANLSEALAKKATPRQRHAFLFNAALLSMHMNKPEQCAELLTQLAASFPESDAPALIRAAQLIRSKAPQQAVEALEAAAAAMPTSSRALLALAQLQLEAKETGRAIATLERIGSLARTPAMIGTLVALHERLGAVDAAAAAFGDGETREPMLRAAADFAARHGMWERAAAAQQKLLDANSRDLQALAGLVIATSHFDSEGANELNARLELAAPPGDDDAEMEDDDAERLEQAALPKKGKAAPADRKRGAAGEEESAEPRRRKKRRKKKPLYPKGFDPENPPLVGPDPERWLPKHERSTYRKTKKEKRAGIRGPQGSATGAARVDARATTNVKELSADEKAKIKAQEEVNERKEAAAAAAAAASTGGGKKKKGKGSAKW